MLNKRTLIVLLVGVNLLLLAVLLSGSYALPAAHAYQSPQGRPGDFVCVTAKAQGRSYDVLWVLDVPQRRLHAYYPDSPQTKQYVPVMPRDLQGDFGR